VLTVVVMSKRAMDNDDNETQFDSDLLFVVE
jgi:hypothetical protein